jgi:8-oxo-dGTP pyrophosphatase MutT (NUDIX family)
MNSTRIDFLKLSAVLQEELPGEEAQFKMAPMARKRIAEMPVHDASIRKAAVMLPLFRNSENDCLLLTVRSIYEGVHSGQVSFPGGKFDENENDAIQVALREMEEEVGVKSDQIQIAGMLSPLFIPVSKMYVQPVVAWVHEPNWLANDHEVALILEIPIHHIFQHNVIKKMKMEFSPGNLVEVPYFDLQGHTVWGATAMIISEFLAVIKKIA